MCGFPIALEGPDHTTMPWSRRKQWVWLMLWHLFNVTTCEPLQPHEVQAIPLGPLIAKFLPQNTLTAQTACALSLQSKKPNLWTGNPTRLHFGKLHPEKLHLLLQETPCKPGLLLRSLLFLIWAEAVTLLDFFLPINHLYEVCCAVWLLVFLGSRLPGYLSSQL